MTPATLLQDVAEERRIRSRCADAHQPRPAGGKAHRPIYLAVGPGGQRVADFGPWPVIARTAAAWTAGRARRDGRPRRRQGLCRRPADRRRHCGRDGSDPRAGHQQSVGATNVVGVGARVDAARPVWPHPRRSRTRSKFVVRGPATESTRAHGARPSARAVLLPGAGRARPRARSMWSGWTASLPIRASADEARTAGSGSSSAASSASRVSSPGASARSRAAMLADARIRVDECRHQDGPDIGRGLEAARDPARPPGAARRSRGAAWRADCRVAPSDRDRDDLARSPRRSRRARTPAPARMTLAAVSSSTPDRIVPSWPGTPSWKAITCARR